MKMNEEEERATLENFMDTSILDLLLNETEYERGSYVEGGGGTRA